MRPPIAISRYTVPFRISCLLVLTFGTAFGQITGDFNGDGIPDLATPGLMRLGNGDGTFRSVTFTIPTGSTPVSIVAGDFNRDGKLDLVSFRPGQYIGPDDGSVDVLIGNGDGTFRPPINIVAGGVGLSVD